jgi:hypothetical protein
MVNVAPAILNMETGTNAATWTGSAIVGSALTLNDTAPSLVLTDTTASAKSLTIAVDANLAQLRESAGASGSLITLDLANNNVGIGTNAPSGPGAFGANLKVMRTTNNWGVVIEGVGTNQSDMILNTPNNTANNRIVQIVNALDTFTIRSLTDALAVKNTLFSANLTTGNVGIGATSPATLLDLLGADNTTVQTIKINATQANVTAADIFIDFRSTTGSEGSIAGTAVAGVIAYNTFTGSHYTQVEDADRADLQVGMLLEATGDAMTPLGKKTRIRTIPEKRHVDEKTGEETITPAQDIEETFDASHKPYLVKSRIARTKGSKAAYGVYGGTDKEGRDLVLALGTGLCYVTKTARAIAVGDYLMASDVAGMMEAQADDIYRNSTVAKAMRAPAWAVGQTSQQIPCIYLGG